jgi:hypothetical protein
MLEPKILQTEVIYFESSAGNPVNDANLHSTVKNCSVPAHCYL